jgi:hypothetical protein
VLGCLVAGCGSRTAGIRAARTPEELRQAVLARAPVGSSLEAAEQVMRAEGFRCARVAHGDFLNRRGIDFLDCYRGESGLVHRVWMVGIVHRDGKVSDVVANTGLVGP